MYVKSFQTLFLDKKVSGYNIRIIQELLRYKNVETTIIYTHMINQGVKDAGSPADFFVEVAFWINIY
jgi:site-specific recombinase XerD